MPIPGYPPPPSGVNVGASSARGWGSGWPVCQENRQVWITLTNGVRLQVRSEVAELARLLLNAVLHRGYQIRNGDSAGFVCRAIGGTLIPSNHSWGLAVDINWNNNPAGTNTTNIPRWMVELMWSYRWYWGGWYDSPDSMHFEYVGTPAQARTDTARARTALAREDDDMTPEQDSMLREVHSLLTTGRRLGPSQTAGGGVPIAWLPRQIWELDGAIAALQDAQARIQSRLAALAASDDVAPTGQVTSEQIGEIVNAELRAVLAEPDTDPQPDPQ